MVSFFDVKKSKGLVIYGCNSLGASMLNIVDGRYVVGFADENYKEKTFQSYQVYDIELLTKIDGVTILICVDGWYEIYDYFRSFDNISVYVYENGWSDSEDKCIICGQQKIIEKRATFFPFINERVFLGNVPENKVHHCCVCGFTYSKYRPNDEEMGRLYSGYRGDEYFEQRHKYEPWYTREFNDGLSEPEDGGAERFETITSFIKDEVDFLKEQNVLDFGGDRGQFIPPALVNAHKYVYEISGNQMAEGVELITNYDDLKDIHWDLIMCNMVMEHLSDPKTYFHNLVELMDEGSYLYIEVPNEDSTTGQIMPAFHEHINQFAPRTLEMLGLNENVKTIKVDSYIRALFKKESVPSNN